MWIREQPRRTPYLGKKLGQEDVITARNRAKAPMHEVARRLRGGEGREAWEDVIAKLCSWS